MTRHVLVVCTANVCRSPVVAGLLNQAFAAIVDIDGQRWEARSAGTGRFDVDIDGGTIRAARAVGLDLSDHRPRLLDRDVLAADGADLILTLERAHLPAIVGLDGDAWPRTFTLKELARRAGVLDPPFPDEDFDHWRERMTNSRTAHELVKPDPADDVADPYGRPRRYHVAMVAEVHEAIERLLRWGPWVNSTAT